MVDAALAETRAVQQRVRLLPSRLVVYLLLAAGLFTEVGWSQVWTRLCTGLTGLRVATPSASASAAARTRVGIAPLRVLFDLLRGAETGCAQVGAGRAGRAGEIGYAQRLLGSIRPGVIVPADRCVPAPRPGLPRRSTPY